MKAFDLNFPLFPFPHQICGKSSATEVIQQLSSPLLVRMIHTKDGSRIGTLCVKHGSAKVGCIFSHFMDVFIKKESNFNYVM